MDLRESRHALLDAVNAHDIEAIKTLVDPSYSARGLGGVKVLGYEEMADYAAKLFARHPDYRESLEIEDERIDGEIGRLTTRRTESFKEPMGLNRSRVSRQVETWKRTDGRWAIVEERAKGISPWAWLKDMEAGPRTTRWSVGLLAACAVVVVASFLPWGSIPATVNFGDMPLPIPIFNDVRLTVTAWNGHLTLPGVKLPNWLVVVGAVAIAAFHSLAVSSVWRAHPLVSVGLAAYGVLHPLALAVSLLGNKGTIEIGLIATLTAYVAALVILIKGLRRGRKGVAAEV